MLVVFSPIFLADKKKAYVYHAVSPVTKVKGHVFCLPKKWAEKIKPRSSNLEVHYKVNILKNFAKFTRNHQFQSIFVLHV